MYDFIVANGPVQSNSIQALYSTGRDRMWKNYHIHAGYSRASFT